MAGQVYLAASPAAGAAAGPAAGAAAGPAAAAATGPADRPPEGWAAVKVFDEALVADEDTRRRLITGALAASVLSGDHLASVIGSDTRVRQPWVASTLVCGPSLASAVAETGPLSADSVGWLALGLASALAPLHRARLAHRAVHPHNALLDADGAVLTDLGTNKNALTAGPGTAADDVYSLGATAYFAATGRSPCDKYHAARYRRPPPRASLTRC